MKLHRAITPFVFVLSGTGAFAQDTMAVVTVQDTDRTWYVEPSLLGILYRDTIALWNPALTIDRGYLHLEARYQWEDWRTASLWAGYNMSFGGAVQVDVAPMIGGVFGNIHGVAPGCLLEVAWKRLSFYSSSEQFIDVEDSTAGFTYTWNELAVDLDHLLVGIVAQRTRTFESPLDLQRGLLLMREQGAFTFGMYLFNIGWTDPTVAFTLSYGIESPRSRPPPKTP
ncbi:MAG: hypothetical protein JNL43_12060 [Flavobacteriales bacterium]|nr:hypothetical protein [Flavobacteriales bacterium]